MNQVAPYLQTLHLNNLISSKACIISPEQGRAEEWEWVGEWFFTSVSKSFSLCFKEQALLTACIKSLQRPCFGTVTVQAAGSALPSQVKTVTVIVRVLVDWSGKERYMKGSNVTEILLHTGQTKVDLYWPCQMAHTNSAENTMAARSSSFMHKRGDKENILNI